MKNFRFEYKISIAYLLVGSLWIIFSDRILSYLIYDVDLLTEAQTYKGWFYVLITAILLFSLLKKHLNKLRMTEDELQNHRNNLQKLVQEKTENLDKAIVKLNKKNEELNKKNNIINDQNVELKNTLFDLKSTQAQLLQADKMASLGILTTGIAHEINNPLNFISGGVTGLNNFLEEKKISNDDTNLFISSINTGVDRISSIVTGLSNFSNKNDKPDEIYNLNVIIDNCLSIVKNLTEDRIEIVRNYYSENIKIKCNVGQLHQLFLNIILNAIQAIEKQGKIEITTKTEADKAVAIIKDSGCGIERADLKKITDPFFTTKDPGKGTGLGLSIAYNIIKEHDGSIEFKSELDKGTTVNVMLPIGI